MMSPSGRFTAVGIGGALGAILRYFIVLFVRKYWVIAFLLVH